MLRSVERAASRDGVFCIRARGSMDHLVLPT